MKTVPVILAGGIGERFWPLSRSSRPKQLLALASRRTMIEEAFSRARTVQSRGVRPLLLTGELIASPAKKLLAEKGRFDMIVEPAGRNTAPAIALAAGWLQERYGDSIMVVLPADHLVTPAGAFAEAVRCACLLAGEQERLVVFGVRPTRPETGYGYIQLGRKTGSHGGIPGREVLRFIEKPDAARAARLWRSASHLWNSGMFVWKTSVILREVKTHLPALFSLVQKASRSGFSRKAIGRFYAAAQSISIDYGIMERSRRVIAVIGKFHWDDIGSWEAMPRLYGSGPAGTTSTGSRIFEQGSRDCIIVNRSPHALAVIGCSGAAIVATEDALLVCSRAQLPYLKRHLAGMKKCGTFPSRLF
ncbi:MAG: mannose-1-phosphate guanylyltransferase [Chitinispirillaceae bacterium]|nr:mannose-1-phosphate guanylyltransferase [Chitinispirillaceae bacterium]